jgi:serine-type D-Ala-D-Ala carboxypeptidase (penicillin-binding protein 5/6)
MRIFQTCITLLFICVAALAPAFGQDNTAFSSKAAEAILIDAKSGAVLYEKDADTAIPPASMSKLVTQAVVFDALKSGQLKLDQEFIVSQDAWRRGGGSAGGSTMYAELNSRIKIDDLIHAAIIQSANDACIILAEGIAGSEEAFTKRMAAKAIELGLKNSSFANATGLPDPNHKMSVRDLSIVARYIITNHPDYYKIYGQPEFLWNKINQANRNPLLKDYPGADGMKTGYTKESGYGLVGSALRDGRRLILVVAGLQSINDRKAEAQKLMDWGFSQFRVVNLYEPSETVSRARVWGGEQHWVNLVVHDALKVALSEKEQENAEVKMSYNGPLIAPIKAGQVVGTVRMILDGKTITEAPLETASEVAAVTSMWSKAWDSLLIMAFGG